MACSRPSIGVGVLKLPDTNAKGGATFAPTSDHYKRFALECSQHQVSVDVFAINDGHIDLSTLGESPPATSGRSQKPRSFAAEAAKYSAGTINHFPNFHVTREQLEVLRFKRLFSRYLTRKIGFEGGFAYSLLER